MRQICKYLSSHKLGTFTLVVTLKPAQQVVLPVSVVKQTNAFHVKNLLDIHPRINNAFLFVLMIILMKQQVAKDVQIFIRMCALNALGTNYQILLEI